MKLAQALQERADLNRRIEQLKGRLLNNALVQEGETPAEEPEQLLDELDRCVQRLEQLIARINLTNCQTMADGESLTALLARKDALKVRLDAYRALTDMASQTARRATRSEIKILSTVDVKNLQNTADQLAKQLRLLDDKLRQTNWTAELIGE